MTLLEQKEGESSVELITAGVRAAMPSLTAKVDRKNGTSKKSYPQHPQKEGDRAALA
jgi:hypothetical protein